MIRESERRPGEAGVGWGFQSLCGCVGALQGFLFCVEFTSQQPCEKTAVIITSYRQQKALKRSHSWGHTVIG